jgi:NADH:ubiquinone oxidoreductase subunit F (NADH-binding)
MPAALGTDVVLPRLLEGAGHRSLTALDTHLALHGPLPEPARLSGERLVEAVERAGLRGRGGAAFPTARKLRAVREAGGRPLVVANGCESEPLSAKDAMLLREAPHLVLDGAALAARAIGAEEVIVATEGPNEAGRMSLERALRQRREARVDTVGFELFTAAECFLTGQETALVSQLNGGLPRPTFIPPRPTERGVRRRPTLIQNVETLAHLALIARRGPDWYRAIGTRAEPGSTLVTMLGAVAAPGVYELESGTPLPALFAAAGGLTDRLIGILVGGYFGSWLPAGLAAELELSSAALGEYGATLGCGIVLALPASACPVAETVRVAIYLATETARQCGPCVHGTAAIARTLQSVAEGRAPRGAFDDLDRWTAELPGRGACHHPNGLAHFVATALETFPEQFAEHARRGPCRSCAAGSLLGVPAIRTRER